VYAAGLQRFRISDGSSLRILAHANAGSEAIMELLSEVEAAVTLAELNIEAERAKAIDLVQSPDPKTAHERVVGAELVRDRLRAVMPKLRDRLSAVLREEAHERWLSDFSRVRQQLDEAVTLSPHIGRNTDIYLPAGGGCFVCTVVGARSGANKFVYARAATWIDEMMLHPDQVPLPKAETADSSVAALLLDP
jgi:hypothetical protein